MNEIQELDTRYDARVLPAMLNAVRRNEAIEELKMRLHIAEAFNFAYVGSKADKQHANARMYAQWQRRIERDIAKLQGIKQKSIWEYLGKSRKI